MKKPYQINKQKALRKFGDLVKENHPAVQLVFPLVQMIDLIRSGLAAVITEIGRRFLEEVMQEEVRQVVGARSRQQDDRVLSRWGTAPGYCVVNGQKVPLNRPRVRNRKNQEVPLGSYEMFQRASLMEETVWERMMRGLSTRKYSEIVQEFMEAYGIEKSTVDAHFIEFSRRKLQELTQRKLAEFRLVAMFIDGTCFRDQNLLVAIGLTCEGYKIVLGLRQISTENATVVKELLTDLRERGVDFAVPRLYVLDGSKGLTAAVKQFAGPASVIQRCQIHKIRNVRSHLSDDYGPSVKSTMEAAYSCTEYGEAKNILDRLHRELMHRNPSAARSLEEGMVETLTMHKLRVGATLRNSLASTNIIESAFSIVEQICRNVKRWRGGDQYLRWVGSALLFAESRFNRVHGYKQIPVLVKEIELMTLKKVIPAGKAAVA